MKPITTYFCLCLFAFLIPGAAQVPNTTGENSAPANNVHPSFFKSIKKTIAIVYTTCEGDSQQYEGTAFFVSKLDPRLGADKGFGYLVTNKHVALPHVETGNPCKVVNQVIRINSKTPDALSGGRNVLFKNTLSWTYPADEAVDLAAIPFTPDQTKFDVEAIPTSVFATKDIIDKEAISEGDSVTYTGYFYQFPGSRQVEPIIRQGIIAMIPDEPIQTTLRKPGKAYLADAHVFGGNSGSPMFVSLGGFRNGNVIAGYRYLFLGVVSGLEPEETDVALEPVATYSGKMGANSGISFIVPADEVLKLLDSPELTEKREKTVAGMQATK